MPRFAPDRIPFSTFGSTMAVSVLEGKRAPGAKEGLYLRCIRNGDHPVLRVQPMRSDRVVDVTATQDATQLWLADQVGGTVELCFDGPETLRIRGRGGLGLRLRQVHARTMAYPYSDRLVTMNVWIHRRYQIESLRGLLSAHEPWRFRDAELDVWLDLLPDGEGTFDVALDEYGSVWTPRSRRGFDDCVSAAKRELDAWYSGFGVVEPAYREAQGAAAAIDWSSVVRPAGLLRRPAMYMSKNWMSHIWAWDNCFNAMALVRAHPDLAWDQLFVVADHQDEHGALPDYLDDTGIELNWGCAPIWGWVVAEMMTSNPPAATEGRLRGIYAVLERNCDYWMTHRRLPGQPLPYYHHGWDSGWDNCSMHDEGGLLWAPDLAAYLVLMMETLADLAERLRIPEAAPRWRDRAEELESALLGNLWVGDRFVARHAVGGAVVRTSALQPCMAVIMGDRLPAEVRGPLARRIESYLTPYGLASELPSSPCYESNGYWRGPIWAPANYLAVRGLESCGQTELAGTIARRFCDLCDARGFAENFDALTGEPYCDPAYTWTSSVFLLLAERLAVRERGR